MLIAYSQRQPVLTVFAGPNGSGKTTVALGLRVFGTYINADDLKKEYPLTDIEAAQQAEALRNHLLNRGSDFSDVIYEIEGLKSKHKTLEKKDAIRI